MNRQQDADIKCRAKWGKNKSRKVRLPFCSQNEKRDLYAMVTRPKSRNKLCGVESKNIWNDERRRGEKMTDSQEEEDVL